VTSGTSLDCNGNEIPDECDLADGSSADCNSNGVPDECDVQPPLGALIWSEDFESGLDGWTTSGLWHVEVGHECLSVDGSLTTVSRAAYNDPAQCNYDVGLTQGALELTTDVVVPAEGAMLRWYNWVETQDYLGGKFDLWRVEVSADGGASWDVVYERGGASQPYWREAWANLSSYAGQSIRVRFAFDTVVDWKNEYRGWYVDDVRIYAIAGRSSSDCNANGVPDECDLADGTSADCNGNGVPDGCDIAAGTSQDCNGNGIPDECDLADGSSADCNGNGVLDECDISSEASTDCDTNGVPDECDPDCNGNGVPDGCDVQPMVGALVWSEDFESGLDRWTTSGLWHVETGHECLSVDGSLTTVSRAAYNDLAQCNYDVGLTQGALELTTDVVVPAEGAMLRWYNWIETEDALGEYDLWRVEVSADGGSSWNVVYDGGGASQPYWRELGANLSSWYAGRSIRVRFVFDTIDSVGNAYRGWYVDDVRLYAIAGRSSSDCNGNEIPDECELADGSSADCDTNGVPDECDVAAGSSQDCNGNGIPDECDISSEASADCDTNGVPDECDPDCNGNGVPDACDLAASTSQDCNGNGVPDECDPDCNGNGVPDACDLAASTSQDCNGNGVPDECDLADESSSDCNGNGVPDECDLVDGSSADCNGNGIPDECDISSGASPDCDTNGIPDECDVQPMVGALVWSEDFESGLDRWTTSGLWHVETGHECLSVDGSLTTVSRAAYNDPAQCNYNVGLTQGALELTTDVVVPAEGAMLRWYNWIETENDADAEYDLWRVEVSADGGVSWDVVYERGGASQPYWREAWANLSSCAGQSIRVRFVFDTVDNGGNGYRGWYVDDVRLYAIAGRSSSDCNGNGVPDACDLADGGSADCNSNGVPDECDPDCNGNGVPDACDLAAGTSQDCNGNGVPDECDPDCNGNGVPDACDLAAGTSQDCNANGIPDECDLADENSSDCNGNGIPDECDVADGSSPDCDGNGVPDECQPDCNGNGVPDACDVVAGTSPDCNGNGFPDECDLADGSSADCDTNGIPDECDVQPMVGALVWSEDFESGLDRWTTSGLWHVETGHECLSVDGSLTTVSRAAYNDPAQCNYNVGLTQGALELTTDVVVPAEGAMLRWYNWIETENDLEGEYDAWRVEASADGGSSWNVVYDGGGASQPYWRELGANLSSYAGQSIRVRFVFDTVDELGNGYRGWYVDDVRLYAIAGRSSSDCNGNGVPDACDLADGSSADCNSNSVPDDCDLTSGTSQDCNGNGVPDECDVAAGTSPDCDGNGVPDECQPDCNSNGVADVCELTSGTAQDCNANGVPDECDLATGTSTDCNSNGVPDECDPDCNGNGVPDACDIANADAWDCNANGIPDECDLAAGTSQDCNANGVPDECDLGNGSSADCNSNGVPDECDIAAGTSSDLNSDAIPDECQAVDLSVTKSARSERGQAGYEITYTIEVTNLGPAAAPDVTVVDPLPSGLSYIESLASQGTTFYADGTLTASLGLLNASSSATVTLRVIPMQPGSYENVATAITPLSDPVTGNNSSFVVTNICPGLTPEAADTFDEATRDQNWSSFAMSEAGLADQIYDSTNTALLARITADPYRFRVAGHVASQAMWVPYSSVGTDHYVRGKFYVFASPHAVDWATTGAMPNVRMRLSHRFAQNAMLEVFNHLNVDPDATAFGPDVQPSTDPTQPSLYRLDFDPVDTPMLRDSATTEGIWAAYEAYSVDPQDEGYVGLAEVSIGVYPRSLLPDTVAPAKVYEPTTADAGTLAVVEPTDLQMWNYLDPAYYGVGEMPEPDTNPLTPGPQYSEGPQGVTLSSVGVPANRLAIVTREFYPGSPAERLRVEANKIYKVRFHVTSTRPSSLQPQLRGRARTIRWLWSQKIEIGGALNAGTESNTDAQQALPGVGCQNPDREAGDTTGGWYTLIVHSPLNGDIRPEFAPSVPVAQRMPRLSSQPRRGDDSNSMLDLRVGFDLLDTLSRGAARGWEEGEFTIDRIEIRVYDEFEDGSCLQNL
jgi:uncharacterized repeat protein (TIGR01451 family)